MAPLRLFLVQGEHLLGGWQQGIVGVGHLHVFPASRCAVGKVTPIEQSPRLAEPGQGIVWGQGQGLVEARHRLRMALEPTQDLHLVVPDLGAGRLHLGGRSSTCAISAPRWPGMTRLEVSFCTAGAMGTGS
jgi:hypothetical protein